MGGQRCLMGTKTGVNLKKKEDHALYIKAGLIKRLKKGAGLNVKLICGSQMRDFFDKPGRTRFFVCGVPEVRRRQKTAENTAYRKNSHLEPQIT